MSADQLFEFMDEPRLAKVKTRIKVDGIEQDVIVGDVLRNFQKYSAADKRLEDAAITKKRAEEDAAATIAKAKAEAVEIVKRANSGKSAGGDGDEPKNTD